MGCSLVHPDAAPDPAGLRQEGRIPAAHEEQVVHPCGGSSPVRRQRAAIRGSSGRAEAVPQAGRCPCFPQPSRPRKTTLNHLRGVGAAPGAAAFGAEVLQGVFTLPRTGSVARDGPVGPASALGWCRAELGQGDLVGHPRRGGHGGLQGISREMSKILPRFSQPPERSAGKAT